jgi:hypothetical protein
VAKTLVLSYKIAQMWAQEDLGPYKQVVISHKIVIKNVESRGAVAFLKTNGYNVGDGIKIKVGPFDLSDGLALDTELCFAPLWLPGSTTKILLPVQLLMCTGISVLMSHLALSVRRRLPLMTMKNLHLCLNFCGRGGPDALVFLVSFNLRQKFFFSISLLYYYLYRI